MPPTAASVGMANDTLIDFLRAQFPDFPHAFWEQVLEKIEQFRRSEHSFRNSFGDVDQFATPPLKAFAISPVQSNHQAGTADDTISPARLTFQPAIVAVASGVDSTTTMTSRCASTSSGISSLNGKMSPDGKRVSHVRSKVCRSPSFHDDQHVGVGEIFACNRQSRQTDLGVTIDARAPVPCPNSAVPSVDVLTVMPQWQHDSARESIGIEAVDQVQATSRSPHEVGMAHKSITDAEHASERVTQDSGARALENVHCQRSSSSGGAVSDDGDVDCDGALYKRPNKEKAGAGCPSTDTASSCFGANKKRSAHAMISSQRQVKVSRISHASHVSFDEVETECRKAKVDPEDVALVLGLLDGIGNPETIDELKRACSAARTPGSYATSDADIVCSVKAVRELEDEQKRIPMLYRYHWLKIVQWRDRKIDAQLEQGRARKTATTLALTELMKLMHPEIERTDHRYKQKYQELIQRTSRARHWLELQDRFTIGILAVIPSANFLGCPPFKSVAIP